MTYLPRANEPVEPHVHEERADGTWGCSTCIAEEAAAGGGGGGVGPAGPAGPVGPAGPAGAKGATGPAGPAGPTGPASTVPGPTGPASTVPGPTGPAGAKGDTGAAGAKGDPGAAGPQGIPGVDGAVGPAGAKGDPGVQGETGAQGVPGIQGIPGMGVTFKGSLPTTGDLPDGAAQGDLYLVETPAPAHGWVWDVAEDSYVDAGPMQGPQGVEGPQGVAGPAGVAGADGVAGPQGVAGKDGAVGPAGPKGDTGTAGATGPAGAKGDTGAAGTAGATGPAGPTAVSADAGNTSVLGTDGKIFTPAGTGGGSTYVLPIASAGTLGGVKVGTGLTVDGTGVLSATVATGFLPLSGGTMTGTITVPTAVNALTFGTSGYGVLGGSGGVAMRSGTTNITTFTGTNVTYGVQLVTANTATAVKFGSAGPSLGVAAGAIQSSSVIDAAAAPTAASHLANKQYVDSKIVVTAAGASAPATTLPAGTLWVEV